VATFGSSFVRKCVAPIQHFVVPNGCSAVWGRTPIALGCGRADSELSPGQPRAPSVRCWRFTKNEMVRQSNVRSAATAKLEPLLTDDLQRQIKGDPELAKHVGELMWGMKSADVTAVTYQLAKGKQNEANALIGEANAARAQGRPDLAGRAAQADAGHRRRRGELQAKQDRAHHHDSR
jgi:hypothetical protein